jgi:hypothetical protein
LWGFCKTCDFAELCRGACNWTAHVFFDKRGNNPYCHHRSLVNAAKGIREHLTMKRQASGLPFDNGEFAIHELPLDASWGADPLHFSLDQVQWPAAWQTEVPKILERLKNEIHHNIANTRTALSTITA